MIQLDVIDEAKKPVAAPYLLRLPGWSWERYIAEAPVSRFCEYENGELVMPSPVDIRHQRVVRFLTVVLQCWCEARRIGEVVNGPAVLKVAPEIGREPDIFVLGPADSRKAAGIPVVAVPLLVVEVVSPSTRRLDMETKSSEYARLGVGEYWVVDLDREILYRHLLESGEYRVIELRSGRLEARTIAGFWIEVDWLWQLPLPLGTECLARIEAR